MSWTPRMAAACLGLLAAGSGAQEAKDLLDPSRWKSPEVRDAFRLPEPELTGPVLRGYLPDLPDILGVRPMAVSARLINGEISSLSVLIWDAGTFFGYQNANLPAGLSPDEGRRQFDTEFLNRLNSVKSSLGRTFAKPVEFALGDKTGLLWPSKIYESKALTVRLVAFEHQLILVDLFSSPQEARSVRCAPWMDTKRRRNEADFSRWLKKDGLPAAQDRELQGIPMLPQGNRGYCGAATLSMVGHFFGLQAGTEDLAPLCGFRYGEVSSTDIRDACGALARAAGLIARRSNRFDFSMARQSIDNGLPVIVFRRFSPERDYLHTTYSKRLKEGEAQAALPAASMEDRKTWPDKNAPAHASIVHGYNSLRREVIFTESWGTPARSRRMRAEEMEGTAYFAVYFVP